MKTSQQEKPKLTAHEHLTNTIGATSKQTTNYIIYDTHYEK